MARNFLIPFFFILIPFLAASQIEKGMIGVTNSFSAFRTKSPQGNLFTTGPVIFANLPTVDYYLTEKWSFGGSVSLNRFGIEENGANVRYEQFKIIPHVKYNLNFSKFNKNFNWFFSYATQYLKQSGANVSVEIDEFSGLVGTGLQLFLSKNIAIESWWQVTIFAEDNPDLLQGFNYNLGFKFYPKFRRKRFFGKSLEDAYLAKGNYRFQASLVGIQSFGLTELGILDVAFGYSRFLNDYFVLYMEGQLKSNFEQTLPELQIFANELSMGAKTYFPIGQPNFLAFKLGLLTTNSNPILSIPQFESFGFDLGLEWLYFFPKRSILKAGLDWHGTASSQFEGTYSSFLPYVGLEVFVNEQVSFEPRLTYLFYQADEENFDDPGIDVDHVKEQTLLFEINIKTLFGRR